MKKLKKFLSVIIIVVLMTMVLAPTATASGFVITPRSNGTGGRATTVSMTNGQSNVVVALLRVHGGSGGAVSYIARNSGRVSATTAWVNTTSRVTHLGWIDS